MQRKLANIPFFPVPWFSSPDYNSMGEGVPTLRGPSYDFRSPLISDTCSDSETFVHISAYLNLALGKPAWQVGDLSVDNTADKAVDGNARNAPTSSCAHGDAADVRIPFVRN